MKAELRLSGAQRSMLASVFKNMLRDEKMYDIWGPTIKSFYEENITWYFTPFKATLDKLPPIECDQRDDKDDKGNVIKTIYKFRIELIFNTIKEMRRTIVLEKEITKGSIDNVV